jgi:hypothetical protein
MSSTRFNMADLPVEGTEGITGSASANSGPGNAPPKYLLSKHQLALNVTRVKNARAKDHDDIRRGIALAEQCMSCFKSFARPRH